MPLWVNVPMPIQAQFPSRIPSFNTFDAASNHWLLRFMTSACVFMDEREEELEAAGPLSVQMFT